MEHKAFTIKGKGRFREIRTKTGLFSVASARTVIPSKIETFEGIWDTGATNTAIASSVVSQLNLSPITLTKVGTGGGEVTARAYLINIVLPNNVIMPNMRVTELKDLNNCDVLIGMDIIASGDFAVTHANGEACCSFRLPSHRQIDFVPETIQHNSFLRTKAGQVVAKAKARSKASLKRKSRQKKKPLKRKKK